MKTKAVTFTIELTYDLEGLRFMTGKDITEEQFSQEAEDYASHDLAELLRANNVGSFSKVNEYEIELQSIGA